MLTKLRSFLKAIWGNIWPTRKKILVNGKTIEESEQEFASKYKEYKRKRLLFSEIFETGRVAIDDMGDVIAWNRYILGCDPVSHNDNFKRDVIKYADYYAKAWLHIADYLKPQPLSGDVSEQSVILPKMDEIIHRTECEELLCEYDKCKNRRTAMAFYNHLIGE